MTPGNPLLRRAALLGLLLAAGCGPPWEGVYSGTMTWLTFRCSNGGVAPAESLGLVDAWIYETDPGRIDLHLGRFGCGPFSGTVEGSEAVLDSEDCGGFAADGYSFSASFPSGTLRLVEEDLVIRAQYRLVYGPTGGAVEGNCTTTLAGTLGRRG